MEYVVKGRKPESVFRWFEEISAIPHGSYHEEKIADFLVAFAEKRGLSCYRDKLNNVLIQAPASAGMESAAPLLLQGHTDMVCEKNADVRHDFLKDSLKLRVEGNFLTAIGTTLGADDGIAVAMMLSLLDGEIRRHPAYECLFTVSEEVGMEGAHGFDYSRLRARRLLNMDSEKLGVVTAGCAGGVRSDLTLGFRPEPFAGDCIRIFLSGLAGGHSGENINGGRANANKLMGRLLAILTEKADVRLVSLCGGSKDNAIPRECEAVLAVPDAEQASCILTDAAAGLSRELSAEDRGFTVTVEQTDGEAMMMSREDTLHAVTVLSCAANGVLKMSNDIPELVEFSRNLGVIRSEEGKLTFVFSSRSSVESQLDFSIRELDLLAAATGCKTRHYSRYPGWNYAQNSDLRAAYLAAYRKVTGRKAVVNVIHAGLECGVIHSKVPDMDMISVGPTMHDIHSPNEKLDLDTVEVFWSVLEELIPSLR